MVISNGHFGFADPPFCGENKRVRLRTALIVFVALNLAWATLFLRQIRQPIQQIFVDAPHSRTAPASTGSNGVVTAGTNQAGLPGAGLAASNKLTGATNLLASTNAVPATTNLATVPSAGRVFGWKEVQTDDYLKYLANLRAIGCPESQVRHVIIQDINDLFDQRRLQEAVSKDAQWWQPSVWYLGGLIGPNVDSTLEEERRALYEKLLGGKWGEYVKLPEQTSSSVARLTGPVLGAMPTETFNTVQEVCNHSSDRYMAYVNSRMADGKPMDSTELAKLRNQTRSDLAKFLSPAEMEEFLLRNSHNAQMLRQELLGFNPTPEEFRKIFRAVDPIDHQLQVEYGGPESLSPKQREQYQRQRELAIQEALAPDRYTAFMQTKDPVYRIAQGEAQRYGLNSGSVSRLVEFYRSTRQQQELVMRNAALTPQQKSEQVQSLEMQRQQRAMQLLQEQVRQQQLAQQQLLQQQPPQVEAQVPAPIQPQFQMQVRPQQPQRIENRMVQPVPSRIPNRPPPPPAPPAD